MIIPGLILSALGLSIIITVVLSELTTHRKRHARGGSNAHLRARLDPIIDEDEEDRKMIRVLITSIIGGLVLFVGFLALMYGMILG
jgi:hypothetical protein